LIFQPVFKNFNTNILLLLSGMQTTQSIKNVMAGNANINQLVNEVSLFLPMEE
jgi:hypothetical protein